MKFVKGLIFQPAALFSTSRYTAGLCHWQGGVVTAAKRKLSRKKKPIPDNHFIYSYAVNKSELIEKMADLVQERTGSIRDIRDESDKDGLTISIDLKSGVNPQLILNNLYKHTSLKKPFISTCWLCRRHPAAGFVA